ncbi:Dyp-type peroxidase [Fulvivirgaceae bacterium BMA12]|uniref:Dyp-type peroxidase n=1 Tax=Agaribacillus aureus TaxID=3051825 RepID=A0ABT8LH94_9BACT|nr:Dyp-type peroxidase [Fulvivirgaceae bacterium BMA12]
MKAIDRKDIQGMLIYGYGRLSAACYLFLSLEDISAFRRWLKATTFQNGVSSPGEPSMNIAFTADGLRKLGLTVDEDHGFSRAFTEGMDTDHRNRILGDYGINASTKWVWGHRNHQELHGVLMLFARDKVALEQFYAEVASKFPENGIREVVTRIESFSLGGKEHFGFKDGVNQPVMQGLGWASDEQNFVNPGEFILGYPNNYDKQPHSPFLQNGQFNFGCNGSYMVFRQLEQDVPLFWKTLCDYFGGVEKGKKEAVILASKMVGRWPNGNPLTRSATEKITKRDLNNFSFYQDDRLGMQCPFGSHIRRMNPRDSLSDGGKKKELDEASRVANNHRILRRGRPYGIPLAENADIEAMLNALDLPPTGSRGLNFICFNTDIDRQFEFVQHTWANNRKFHNLYNDVDPIVGVQRSATDKNQIGHTQFEAQTSPVRKRYQDLPPFVRVKGGSYFFMPGLTAIDFLSKE